MSAHPYRGLPETAFWKRSVADRHYEELQDLWTPPVMAGDEMFATAGSCFAQHIGRHVRSRSRGNFLELEPAPLSLPEEQHERFGFGTYSCRYGNIYTTRQLLQVAQEALGIRPPSPHVWERDGRFYDAVRPSVDPVGLDSPEEVLELRATHLTKVREMLENLDVLVFTLGLTEAWLSPVDGTAFPSAPGVIAGDLQQDRADFHNLTAAESEEDMRAFWDLLRDVNPRARMLLTVSPVPLIATASGNHVLPATTYSKAVLRVVAENMQTLDGVHYFPSYEIISSAQGRGYYFEPDLRSVNKRGVDYVMSHFFAGDMGRVFPVQTTEASSTDVVCDEEAIEDRVEQETAAG